MREHKFKRTGSRFGMARISGHVYSIALLLALVSPGYAWAIDLVYSLSADRSNSVLLEGASLQGPIYVTVSGVPRTVEVDFYVDDPERSGSPHRYDHKRPYDLIGGSWEQADAWDLNMLAPGPHTVTAIVRTKEKYAKRNRFRDKLISETLHATFTVENPEPTNLPPSIQNVPAQSAAEGQVIAFTVSASDPDNGPPSLSASSVPQGATFTPSGDGSAEFSWTPGYDAAGAYSIGFTATDAEDATLTASVDVVIDVANTNRPPSLTPINPQSIEAGQALTVNVSATDPDGTIPFLTIPSLPAGAMFTDYGDGSGALVWDASNSDVGEHSLTVTARDAAESALADSGQMLITVTEPPSEPLGPLTVEWDPHPQTVVGFKVFFGPSEETAIVQVSELRVDSGEINAGAPSVTYDPETDLGLQPGDTACFRVSAFNDVVESPPSQVACI